MKSWQLFEYGEVDKLVLNESAEIPAIVWPADILVKVKAASVNPIDNLMMRGYGSEAFQELKRISSLDPNHPEFPLSLGRDFAGTVVEIGPAVSGNFKLNDEVWGTLNVDRQGSFSQYVTVSSDHISHKPPSLTSTQASSLPYVASTIWNCLSPISRDVSRQQLKNKKVLVLGGSGGVGTFAIQFFNAYGAEVTTTVAPDFVARAAELGASNVVDYHKPDAKFLISALGRYDLILDLINIEERNSLLSLLPPASRLITINFPFFTNLNSHGVFLGSLKSASQLLGEVVQGLQHGSLVSWGAYSPNKKALDAVYQMVEEDKLQAVVESVFPFDQIPEALSKVKMGHNRGKTVIDFEL